jgi:hypothetical protein
MSRHRLCYCNTTRLCNTAERSTCVMWPKHVTYSTVGIYMYFWPLLGLKRVWKGISFWGPVADHISSKTWRLITDVMGRWDAERAVEAENTAHIQCGLLCGRQLPVAANSNSIIMLDLPFSSHQNNVGRIWIVIPDSPTMLSTVTFDAKYCFGNRKPFICDSSEWQPSQLLHRLCLWSHSFWWNRREEVYLSLCLR